MPEITILMPVRNGEKYIKESIDSILKQTFTDFELLIMDDGSTDRTVERIERYTDERIRLIRRKHNFIRNLNEGLELALGTYIARMDADDIMHTERLRIQLKRMKKNPNITVCGTWAKIFSDKGNERNVFHFGHEIICEPVLELLKYNMLLHPSVMVKKEFLFNHHIKYQNYPYVEDYKLWFDIAKAGGILFVEPQELMMLRRSDTQVTVTKKEEMFLGSIRLRKEILLYLLSIYDNKALNSLLSDLEYLEKNKWMSYEDIFRFFVNLFNRMQSNSRI
ncbi:MAG: glycosyltransferase family 2 protein [Bacteroides thetaiotaomicron]|uniref:Glycosyltransferase family 2 protein n=1 Tax=Bacteroides thetaiotaomicron TaxID=818 RepID=A0A943DV80_BACT4|nr:glycosyltransferase family 2 protein [Bacteroides thetaiotaomicron]